MFDAYYPWCEASIFICNAALPEPGVPLVLTGAIVYPADRVRKDRTLGRFVWSEKSALGM